MTTATEISARIIEAVMGQRLAPGSRLGELQLSILFDCSRTVVREALTRLAARGIVTVSARRGWFVIEPSQDEAREAFEARHVIELGLIRCAKPLDKTALHQLKEHLQREKAALKDSDIGMRSFLLGDFHVCLAECLGNTLLADTLRDFTARTILIAMLHQSSHDAAQSCEDHVQIVAALERGDIAGAEALMAQHIGSVQSGLRVQPSIDPLAQLRDALAPMSGNPASKAPALQKKIRTAKGAAAKAANAPPAPENSSNNPTDDPSTYLGALL
jgi:DNA-binding GntR family transcriptional regulator